MAFSYYLYCHFYNDNFIYFKIYIYIYLKVILLFIHIFIRCKWKFNMRPESTNRRRFRSIISIQRDLSQEQAYIFFSQLSIYFFTVDKSSFFVFLKVCTEPIYNHGKKTSYKKEKNLCWYQNMVFFYIFQYQSNSY